MGEETRARHKTYLIQRIIWRLQAKAEGDLSVRARRRAEQLADEADEAGRSRTKRTKRTSV